MAQVGLSVRTPGGKRLGPHHLVHSPAFGLPSVQVLPRPLVLGSPRPPVFRGRHRAASWLCRAVRAWGLCTPSAQPVSGLRAYRLSPQGPNRLPTAGLGPCMLAWVCWFYRGCFHWPLCFSTPRFSVFSPVLHPFSRWSLYVNVHILKGPLSF